MGGAKTKLIMGIFSVIITYGLVMLFLAIFDGVQNGEWYKLVMLIPVVIIFSAARTLYKLFIAPAKLSKQLAHNGAKSLGFVESVEQTGNYVNNQPQVKITLNVINPLGGTIKTSVTEVVSLTEMHKINPGSPLPVIFDKDTQKCVLDKQPDVAKMQDMLDRYAAENDENGLTYDDRIEIRQHGKMTAVLISEMKIIEARDNGKLLIDLTVNIPASDHSAERSVTRRMVITKPARDMLHVGKIVDVMIVPGKEERFSLVSGIHQHFTQ